MSQPAGTGSDPGAASPPRGPRHDRPNRPSWLRLLLMKTAGQAVLVVVGQADLHTANQAPRQHHHDAADRGGSGDRQAPAATPDVTARPDQWRELERVVEQLARLVLGAAAVAERSTALASAEAGSQPGRAQRLQRLHAGVELGQRALAAAVALT